MVCSERLKWAAISLFVRPRAIRGTSCRSRRVSGNGNSSGTAPPVAECCATKSKSTRENCGGQTAALCATARTAATTSDAAASRRTYPVTPCFTASRNNRSLSSIAISTIFNVGRSARICRTCSACSKSGEGVSRSNTSAFADTICSAVSGVRCSAVLTEMRTRALNSRARTSRRRRLPETMKRRISWELTGYLCKRFVFRQNREGGDANYIARKKYRGFQAIWR